MWAECVQAAWQISKPPVLFVLAFLHPCLISVSSGSCFIPFLFSLFCVWCHLFIHLFISQVVLSIVGLASPKPGLRCAVHRCGIALCCIMVCCVPGCSVFWHFPFTKPSWLIVYRIRPEINIWTGLQCSIQAATMHNTQRDSTFFLIKFDLCISVK